MSAPVSTLPLDSTNDPYADESVARSFTRPVDDGVEAFFVLDGIRCGGCALTIEKGLRDLRGVRQVEVNFATHRAHAIWDPTQLRLVDLMGAVQDLGYGARPYDPARRETGLETERRIQLRRLGVAGVFGMQVMTISVALYAGDFSGMQSDIEKLLRWAALVLSLPVIGYAGLPFFISAIKDLRRLRTGMDVPVALGLFIAFTGSVHATATDAGAVYFDSVVMFVFFLLLARYLEFSARARHARVAESMVTAPPVMALRIVESGGNRSESGVAAASLAPGDRVLIRPGDTVPADGIVVSGESTLDESLLTGESRPTRKRIGDEVIAGSMNFENPIEMSVSRAADNTLLANTLRLMERALGTRPRLETLADRVAGRFVGGVLVFAVAVAVFWWHAAPDQWLPVTISVLVITCPCALSLATPAALTAGIGALTRRGLIVTRGHVLETLAKVTRFVFDKTGTLTRGKLEVIQVTTYAGMGEPQAMAIAASLERHSRHPVGRVLARATETPFRTAVDVVVTAGRGVEGRVDGDKYFIGSKRFVEDRLGPGHIPEQGAIPEHATEVLLANESAVIARIALRDEPRADAASALACLGALGFRVSLLSGDRASAAVHTAGQLGIDDAAGDLLPSQKLEKIRQMQSRGEIVAAVGDGINDTPVLAGADVSFAMGDGPEAARASADVILLGERLQDIAQGILTARKTRRVIAQNIAWALGYNLLALPAAAMGYVPPWLAAIGMSLSSLIVVANSLRAGSIKNFQRPGP